MFDKILTQLKEAKNLGILKQSDPMRKKVNKACQAASRTRWKHPKDAFDDIQTACKNAGLVIVDEENSEWSGMWSAGKSEQHETTFMLARMDSQEDKGHGYKPYTQTIENAMLVFQWYKDETQKTWEVNAYLS